jgi:hypothetical protein
MVTDSMTPADKRLYIVVRPMLRHCAASSTVRRRTAAVVRSISLLAVVDITQPSRQATCRPYQLLGVWLR